MTHCFPLLRAVALTTLLLAAGGAPAASAPLADEQLAALTAAYMRAVWPGEQADLHKDLFKTVLQRVSRSYARDVDMPSLVAAALKTVEPLEPQAGEPVAVFRKTINAALATLDPHSSYLDARGYSSEKSAMRGAFGGLGLQVDMVDGLVRVVTPMPDTPAARAGLRAGDLIVRFDEEPVQGMALNDAVARMRGEPGTPIALMIRRAGVADEFSVSLVREVIRTQPVRWSMEGDVLVLKLAVFSGSAFASMEKAIADATATRRPRGIVLDVRGNPGGLLREAVSVADAFLTAGEIVSMRTRGSRKTWQADPAELLAGVPMVVLIDGRSASASELLAAALQENRRATVMGQRSYGKGSVQSIVPLGADKGALRLTIALYHGPSGRTVQRTGVGPDIELVLAPAAAAPARRREADRAHALPGADEPAPPKALVEQSRCAAPQPLADPALACALAYLAAGGVDAFVAALEPRSSATR